MVIQDFKDKKDEINLLIVVANKIKLKQKGKDTLIYSGKDLLATVKKTKRMYLRNHPLVSFKEIILFVIELF